MLPDAAQQEFPRRRQALQVQQVRQALHLGVPVSGPPWQARRRQAVQVRDLSEAVQPQDGPAPPPLSAHGREAVHVRDVRQGLHPQGPHAEALRHPPAQRREPRPRQEKGGAHFLNSPHHSTVRMTCAIVSLYILRSRNEHLTETRDEFNGANMIF